MSLFAIVLIVIFVILLLIFLIYRNQKEEQSFEEQLNNDYPKKEDLAGDIEVEEKLH